MNIQQASVQQQSPVDLDALQKKIIQAESSGNPRATGDQGKSRGLMQIQEPTWRRYTDEPFDNAYLPERNYQIGRAILQHIHDSYGPNASEAKVAYTYNTGRTAKSALPAWTAKHPNKIYRQIFTGK